MNVRIWLSELDLTQYAQIFEANDIDSRALRELSGDDLKELGISLGHRKILLKAILELNERESEREGEARSESPVASAQVAPASAVAEPGERRQLTVLFCDMVGFTELANRVDPEVLQSIIRVYEDACAVSITRYEGYVFQRLGDGIVAFFGYPLAHEGEAERAIHAGLSIIESLSRLEVPDVGRLQVRIGIATGVVVVSSAEKGAVGETMNLASRLQGTAQVGHIVVSERVRRLAGGSFEYADLGEQTLKGIAQPTRAYGVVEVSQAASRFEAATQTRLTPMVGRELEISMLLERWGQAQEGEGQVVLLCGEAGIGKSRILSVLRERLSSQEANTLHFQCSPYHVNSAFHPLTGHFERALKFARDEPSDAKLDKLEARLVAHYARPRTDVRFLATMLSIPCEDRYGAITMTPQKHKDETLRVLVDVMEATAHKQSSVMLFEDAHWADPTTLEVLDLLIDRVRTVPLLIVLTHRPEFQNRWASHAHVVSLNLSKLTKTQAAAMVAKVAGNKTLPADLLEKILIKTDGVPLFVEELTKSILESGELKETADSFEYIGNARDITIPATLRDSLMARLDRVSAVKEIAQIGSAIGREFNYELIQAVAPMSRQALDDALAQLTHSGLAYRRGTPPEATYTFKHALVQDAAYDSLLKSRRQALHAAIAKVIEEHFPHIQTTEPEVLAHHLTHANNLEQAIPLWQSAGELAMKRIALSDAISHLNKGLELITIVPPSSERDTRELALRTRVGAAWQALKGWVAPEIWSGLHRALDLARSLERNDALLPILLWLHNYVSTQGRVAESLPPLQEMLDIAKATGDADLLVMGHMAASSFYFWMGDLIKSLEHHDTVLALYDDAKHAHLVDILNEDPKTHSGGLVSLATWMLGYPDRAVEINEEIDAHARRRGHPFDLGLQLFFGTEVFEYRCEPEKVRLRAEECARLGRENSMPVGSALWAPLRLGLGLIREGKAAEGIPPLKAGLAYWHSIGGKIWSPYGSSILAEGMAMTGDLDNALNLIDEQIAQVERPGWEERVHYAEILRLKGWMLTLKGDLARAERNYLASLDWARTQQAKSWELRISTSLARLWQSQGKRQEALDLLKPVYDWFTEGFDTKDLKDAKALLEDLSAVTRH